MLMNLTRLTPVVSRINPIPVLNAIHNLERAILSARLQKNLLETEVKIAVNLVDGQKYEKIDVLC